VKLNKTSLSLKTGQTFKLKAAISPKKVTNKKVVYKSSNKAVASVTAKGVVKAGSAGTAKITAAAADGNGKSAKYTMTVARVNNEVVVTGVTLDKTSLVLEPGQQEKLSAAISPSEEINQELLKEEKHKALQAVDSFRYSLKEYSDNARKREYLNQLSEWETQIQ
jgi:uncharacterized protein YjdB